MNAGINQWSLPLGDQDLGRVLQHAVRSGITDIELCIEPFEFEGPDRPAAEPELDDLFRRIARAVDAEDYLLKLLTPADELDRLKATVLQSGARVVSVTTLDLFRYTLTSNDGKNREAAAWLIRKMIDACARLGGRIVLIEPGVVTSGLRYADAYRNCQRSLQGLAKYAEERNIVLALENVWGKFLMSPLEFRDLVDGIRSEAVGAYFDVANILEFGFPQDWILELAGRIKSIHFKDYRLYAGGASGFCNPFNGDVDWYAVKRALEKIGYSGSIVAEVIKPKARQDGFIEELGRKLGWFINEL